MPQLVSFCPNETTVSFGVAETAVAVSGAGVFPSARYAPVSTITTIMKMTTAIDVTVFSETPVNALITLHLHLCEPTISESVMDAKSGFQF